MLRPIVASGAIITPVTVMLCDIEAKGLTEGASGIGRILISALSAFHPEVDGYSLIPEPPLPRQFSTNFPLDWQEMRPQMLIAGLGAYQPEVDRYPLLPEPSTGIKFPTNPPLINPRGEMRALRMGLGLGWYATGPALLVRTYDCDEPIGEDFQQSLKQLAELGKSVAPFIIGEIMLRKLAAMHPDVLPPLFPTMAL